MKQWSEDIENILIKIRLCSLLRCKYHKKTYFKLVYRLNFFRIPVIILSSISSVTNVAFINLIPYEITSVLCCFLSVSITLISTIEMFLKIRAQMETNLHNTKAFSLLALDITKILSLKRENRYIDGLSYLDDVVNKYNLLVDQSLISDLDLDDKILSINLLDKITAQDENLLLLYENKNSALLEIIKENESFKSQIKDISIEDQSV